ncbi:MAG: type II secretion system secretin GspD [Magnetococcales bacterium]|nr:type II secretion system secretin GspD [Magnetococcales bacterium]
MLHTRTVTVSHLIIKALSTLFLLWMVAGCTWVSPNAARHKDAKNNQQIQKSTAEIDPEKTSIDPVQTSDLKGVVESKKEPSPITILRTNQSADDEDNKNHQAKKIERTTIHYGTGEFYKGTVISPPKGKLPKGQVTLNFVDTDIKEVVRTIFSEVLNVNYLIDKNVNGKITIRTSGPVGADVLLTVLEETLRIKGFIILKPDESGFYKILPIKQAILSNTKLYSKGKNSNKVGYSFQIVPLRYISVDEIKKILTPISPKGSIVHGDQYRNILILGGTPIELSSLMESIELFDVDWMRGMSVGFFKAEYVDIKLLIKELKNLFKLDGGSPMAQMVRLIPVDRINGVLAVTTQPEYLEQIDTWIKRLDQTTDSDQQRLFVYHVQNGRADKLAETLRDIFSTSSKKKPSVGFAPGKKSVTIGAKNGKQPTKDGGLDVGQNEKIKIIASNSNNSLLILCTSKLYRIVESALHKLDIMPQQVLIEATIAEVTLNKELSYGLQWFLKKGDFSMVQSETTSGDVASAFPGFSFLAGGTNITTVLNALESVTDLKVISSPQVLVLDNQEAVLSVGDQVPVVTKSAQDVSGTTTSTIVSSVSYRNTGTILTVKPQVNASGMVLMEITQEVSDVSATTVSGIDSPTIQQRKISSTIVVQSGETIALGGLIKDKNNVVESGIPLLHKIPYVGGIFGGNDKENERTELLILITPRVVSSIDDVRNVTQELRDKLRTIVPLHKKIEKTSATPKKTNKK